MTDRTEINQSKLLRASGWAVASRWAVRLLGLVSTVVLARLLTPADFGVVGMAMIVVGFSESLLEFGVRSILIHRSNLSRQDYDTAWTFNLIQNGLGAAIIVAGAFPAATYFHDSRLEPVLFVLAAGVLFGGLSNIGVVDYQRDLDMGRDFVLFIVRKLTSVVLSISIAIVYQSYWAMVYAYVGSRIAEVVISYIMHSYRPRLSLAMWSEFLGFSSWLTIRQIGTFAQGRLDRLLVGGRNTTSAMGQYTVASELSEMLISELLAPLARALLPAFAALQKDTQRLNRAAEKSIGGVAALAMPASVGLSLVAGDVVPIVFGTQWGPAVPLLEILALAMLIKALIHPVATLLTAIGSMAVTAWGMWVQVAVFFAVWALFFTSQGLRGIAEARLVAAVFYAGTIFWYAHTLNVFRGRQLVLAFMRPAASTAVMALVLLAIRGYFTAPALTALFAQVVVGGIVYALTLLGTWSLMGRPAGLEEIVVSFVARRIGAGS